jgi:hypothetical protein
MLTIDEATLDDLLDAARTRAERIETGTDAADHTAYAAGYRDGAAFVHRGISREAE